MLSTDIRTTAPQTNSNDSPLCGRRWCLIYVVFNSTLGGGGGFASFVLYGIYGQFLSAESDRGAARVGIPKGNSIGATFVSLTGLAGFIKAM
jgi:hypothetical protein